MAITNDIRVCDKCKHISIKKILPKLNKLVPDADVKVGCKSYCGPCAKRAFIFVNGRYVTAPTEDEVIEKIRPFLKK